MSGMPPFVGKDKEGIYDAIINKPHNFKASVWESISSEAKDFINQCLVKDYNNRP